MFEREIQMLREQHLLRTLSVVDAVSGPVITLDGKQGLLFCSNDYLGLAADPALRRAAAAALDRPFFGSGASRLISGTSSLHRELEQRIARFKETEDALLFNSGYAANTGIIPVLVGEGDAIVSDSLNHASIIDGCRLSRAAVHIYRHCDLAHAEDQLKKCSNSGRRLIVTDGVFSMDGDIAPLPGLADLAQKYDAMLMVDDAHATGVLGRNGKGTAEHFGLEGRVHVQMGTLGKALGSFGAFAAGNRDTIHYLVNRARSFIFSTSLPPSVCAASIAGIDAVENRPELRELLRNNIAYFAAGLKTYGIDAAGSQTPIIPILTGYAARAVSASRKLCEQGIFATAIRPPTVPEGSSRIRMTIMATHSRDHLNSAIQALSNLKKNGIL